MAFNPVFAGVGDNDNDVFGATLTAMFTITFGGADTYVAGGVSLTQANFGMSRPIAGISVIGKNTAALGFEWFWNPQTQKLQAIQSTTGAPIPFVEATGSVANHALTVLVWGRR